MISADIGIDLGTATVLVFVKGRGTVLQEPSVVAINKDDNDKILAVGEEARNMLGRTPGNIIALRPMREGVISDYHITQKMLEYFIRKAVGRTLRKPRIAICVPSNVTEVEHNAVMNAAKAAGARQVFVIEEPIAAAIGAGIDIERACGSMIVDIGGGTTDVAVISLGGTVERASIKTAGDHFDEAIVRYMRKKHSILIGERTAEELKKTIGTAFPRASSISMDVRGRNLVTGLPVTITATSEEMQEALQECVDNVVEAVHMVLERTPPELAADIYDRGIVMTGGGSLLHGLNKLISQRTGINTIIAEDAESCVAIGTGEYIEYVSAGKVNPTAYKPSR